MCNYKFIPKIPIFPHNELTNTITRKNSLTKVLLLQISDSLQHHGILLLHYRQPYCDTVSA